VTEYAVVVARTTFVKLVGFCGKHRGHSVLEVFCRVEIAKGETPGSEAYCPGLGLSLTFGRICLTTAYGRRPMLQARSSALTSTLRSRLSKLASSDPANPARPLTVEATAGPAR
jgi:hypothetical protein